MFRSKSLVTEKKNAVLKILFDKRTDKPKDYSFTMSGQMPLF